MVRDNKLFYYYGLIFILELLACIFVNRYPVPYEDHWYASKVDFSQLNDQLLYFYSFLKTPSYFFLEPFFNNAYIYLFLSFFINIVFSFVLYYMILKFNKDHFTSLVIAFIFSPLFLALFSKIFIDPGFRVIHVMGYASYMLSTRYIFGFLSLFSLFFLIQKKYNYALIFYALSMMAHPSSGLLNGLFLLTTIVLVRADYKYILNFFAASIVGLAPSLIKLIKVNTFNIGENILSKKDWYLRLIHDEPDDFSILYHLAYHLKQDLFAIITILLVSFFIYKKKDLNLDIKKILLSILLCPVFYFLIFGLLEYISVITENFYFIDPIIKSQAGYKILKFSFFPLIFAAALILKDIDLFKNFKLLEIRIIRFVFFISLVLIPAILVFADIEIVNQKIKFVKNLKKVRNGNYLDYLNARSFRTGDNNFAQDSFYIDVKSLKPNHIKENLNIFELKKYHDNAVFPDLIDETSKKYNNKSVYNGLISMIENNIPENSSIIMIPYILYVRDVLPKYNYYYFEKADANLGLGSRVGASIVSLRLKDLIDVDHKDLHSDSSGLLQSELRTRYLKINNQKINFLRKKYPSFKYFITEKGHELNFTKVNENEFYILYQIN